jgi:hypothetical protein
MKVLFLFFHVILLIIDSEMFIQCLFVCLFFTIKIHTVKQFVLTMHINCVRFDALEEVFMSYRPHGAWRTMEVLEELA